MQWAHRQWAVDQCVADWKEADLYGILFPDVWARKWLMHNSHKYRTNEDTEPVSEDQVIDFMADVMATLGVKPDPEVEIETTADGLMMHLKTP